MHALMLWLASSLALSAGAEDLTGTVTSIEAVGSRQIAHFRTPTESVDLYLDLLPQATRDQLSDPSAKTSRIQIKAEGAQIVSRAAVPFGVRSDCSELPVTVDELDKLAKDPNTKSMVDFLKKVPPGTLQGFTFVTNSKSAQRGNEEGEGKVSPTWPRALRASIDGQLTITFVCDPKNPAFGKVEVLELNKKSHEWETTEWDFGTPEKPVPPEKRVHKNPESCVDCHQGSMTNLGGKPHPSLKPNWPEYFFWGDCKRDRGITLFGMSDDNLGGTVRDRNPTTLTRLIPDCNAAADNRSVQEQNQEWLAFRATQKDNECFNTLPWAKVPPGAANAPVDPNDTTGDYRYYPYAVRAQDWDANNNFNYSLRTNTRFTDGYSHYMAERNYALIKNDPDYELMKYFLAMEEAQCLQPADVARIKEMLGDKFRYITADPTGITGRYSFPSTQPVLYSYSKKAGLDDQDWTMEFKLKGDPNYNAVAFEGYLTEGAGLDAQIYNLTTGNIFKEIREENKLIRDLSPDPLTRGISEDFGPRFSCIDDIGGRIRSKYRSPNSAGASLCAALRSENNRRIPELLAKRKDCEECRKLGSSANPAEVLATQLKKVERQLDKEAAERGRQLVKPDGKGKCVRCHSSAATQGLPDDLLFVLDERASQADQDATRARLKARFAEGNFIDTVERRVVKSKGMPPGGLGKDLTDQDRNDILSYIQSLMVAK